MSRPQSSAWGSCSLKDAGEAAFAAADIEHALAAQVAEVVADQLDVVDAGIDGGGEMLLVGGGLVEGGLDAGAQLGGELRARGLGKQALPVHARVRKMGRPSLRS